VRAKRTIGRLASLARSGRGPRVLTYHSITDRDVRDPGQMMTSVGLLSEHLSVLREEGGRIVSLRELRERICSGSAVDGLVAITFDDGFSDFARLALPALVLLQAPATVFVMAAAASGDLGSLRNPWPGTYLGWGELREVVASGLVEVGCHGATHRRLRGLPAAAVAAETIGAKVAIEDGIGKAVDVFAYPFGSFDSYDEASRSAVEGAGFAAAFTGVFGTWTAATERFTVPRCRVSWAESADDLRRLARGAYDWYALVQRIQARRA